MTCKEIKLNWVYTLRKVFTDSGSKAEKMNPCLLAEIGKGNSRPAPSTQRLKPHQPSKHVREQSIEEDKEGHGGWFNNGSAFRPDIFGNNTPGSFFG